MSENLDVVFSAPSTTDRDRNELLGILLADVSISVDRAAGHAELVLRWEGGAVTELTVPLIARPQDGSFWTGPAGQRDPAVGRRCARRRLDLGHLHRGERTGSSGPGGIIQSGQLRSRAPAVPPLAGRVRVDLQLPGDDLGCSALAGEQHDAGPQRQALLGAAAACQVAEFCFREPDRTTWSWLVIDTVFTLLDVEVTSVTSTSPVPESCSGQRHAAREHHSHGEAPGVYENVVATAALRPRPEQLAATDPRRHAVPR